MRRKGNSQHEAAHGIEHGLEHGLVHADVRAGQPQDRGTSHRKWLISRRCPQKGRVKIRMVSCRERREARPTAQPTIWTQSFRVMMSV